MAKSWDKAQLSWFSKDQVHPIASTCSLKCQKKSKEPVHKKWSLMDQYCSQQKYFSCFVKRTPDTLWQVWNDGMVWGGMVWYELEWYGIGMWFPYHGMMELVWRSYHSGMGYLQGLLIPRIGPPHRYPKMGDWSGGRTITQGFLRLSNRKSSTSSMNRHVASTDWSICIRVHLRRLSSSAWHKIQTWLKFLQFKKFESETENALQSPICNRLLVM